MTNFNKSNMLAYDDDETAVTYFLEVLIGELPVMLHCVYEKNIHVISY